MIRATAMLKKVANVINYETFKMSLNSGEYEWAETMLLKSCKQDTFYNDIGKLKHKGCR